MAKELFPLYGIITVLNTPFKENGNVDLSALQKHVEYALEAGVAGFLVPAMAAEVGKLSEPEKLEMTSAVLETVDSKVPVFAGAGTSDVKSGKSLIKSYLNLGCRHILFQIPYQNEVQFKRDFVELADTGPTTIMLQDWDASGYGLGDELILELFETVDAFRCLKIETIPAGVKYSRILKLTAGALHVSGGWAVSQMLEGLQRGVHAFMPTGMHYVYTEIYHQYRKGNISIAEKLFYELLPVLNFSNQHLDISIHFYKRLLHRQGIYPTDQVRNTILTFDPIHQGIADPLIEGVIKMEERIKESRKLELP